MKILFKQNFKNQLHTLCQNTLNLLEHPKIETYKIGLLNPLFGDSKRLKSIIEATLNSSVNPSFLRCEPSFEVYNLLELTYEEEMHQFDEFYEKYEYAHKQLYWSKKEINERFSALEKFSCFEELILNRDEALKQTKKRSILYNVGGWLSFFRTLSSNLFVKYELDLNCSTKQILRFSTKLSNNLYAIIEYDERSLKKELLKGTLLEPEYRLLLVTEDFDKHTKPIDYLTKTHPDIIYLGQISHPIIDIPSTPLSSYFGRKNLMEVEEGVWESKYVTQIEHLGKNQYRLYNDESFGEDLIKHAFYQLDTFAFFSNVYLNYIEVVIQNVFHD